MLGSVLRWIRSTEAPLVCVELFALGNLSFLALDVFIAHSANEFAHPAEWIPFVYSLLAPVALVIAWGLSWRTRGGCCLTPGSGGDRLARRVGLATGWLAILVGIAGLLWHLDSSFFAEATLINLVYSAPFVAPLAYTGVGFLLVLDRSVASGTMDWARWVIVLALGGFVGNFVLSLADHAQNGFFEWREWIPVVAAAIAVGNLSAVVFVDSSRSSIKLSAVVMLLQILTGVLGAYYHLEAMLASNMDSTWEKVVYSAPLFAPLLFANLAILALFGLWSLWVSADSPAPVAE
jgi:hypothetical protein